ncbi:MAG: putative quinol monooxygenase [Aeoliella sp.]
MTVLARLRVVVSTQKRGDVMRTLRSLLGPTQVEPGCLGCHFYQDAQDENVLSFEEEWQSEGDLNRHLRSDQYRKLLAVVDAAAEQPEIRFDRISSTEGIEVIERARTGANEKSNR